MNKALNKYDENKRISNEQNYYKEAQKLIKMQRIDFISTDIHALLNYPCCEKLLKNKRNCLVSDASKTEQIYGLLKKYGN